MPKRYKYGILLSITIFVCVLLTSSGILIMLISIKIGQYGFIILFLPLTTLVGFATVITFLVNSPIEISNEGIFCRRFGRRMHGIRWEDVIKIKKYRSRSPGLGFRDTFHVSNNDTRILSGLLCNIRGTIMFTDDIRNLRDLLDQINNYACQYGFPLVVVDQEAAGKLAAKKGAGYWKQRLPGAEEVRVDRL